jgi:endonuclease G
MQLKVTLLLLFIPLLTFSQLRDSVRVKTPIYEIIYSEKLESPLWVKYEVLCTNGKASRENMDFYRCDSIHTSDDADYRDNEWDKGHMAPAAAFNCTPEMLRRTFSYLNCALQNQGLNRGAWKALEKQEREWAKTQVVMVTIEVKFDKKRAITSTGATIPSSFTKKIHLLHSKKKYTYSFPNKDPKGAQYSSFLVK